MKRSLMRPTDVVLPLAGIAAMCVDRLVPMMIFVYYFMLQLLSLCAVDSFRIAAAREPGVRRVDKRFTGSILPLLLGMGLSLLILHYIGDGEQKISEAFPVLGAAMCMTIEQLFEERMHAIGKSVDVTMMSIVSGLLLFAGMVLDGFWMDEEAMNCIFTLCGAGLGALVAMIASFIAEPLRAFSLIPRNIPFCPKAAVQSLLYPAAMAALMISQGMRGDEFVVAIEEYLILPLLIGLVFWRISRTVCRRASDESRPLNLLLVSAAALAVIIHQMHGLNIIPGNLAELTYICAEGMILLLICAIIVFCAPGWRLYTGAILLAAACSMNVLLPGFYPYAGYASIALCIIAAVLNMHKAFLKKV